jgi:hypothetical protein
MMESVYVGFLYMSIENLFTSLLIVNSMKFLLPLVSFSMVKLSFGAMLLKL